MLEIPAKHDLQFGDLWGVQLLQRGSDLGGGLLGMSVEWGSTCPSLAVGSDRQEITDCAPLKGIESTPMWAYTRSNVVAGSCSSSSCRSSKS